MEVSLQVSQKFLVPKSLKVAFFYNLESLLKGKIDGLKHKCTEFFENSGP